MDKNFWRQKWKNNKIAFHKSEANPFLVQHFKELSLEKGSRVFVPLCGKTLDIAWLLAHGYRVAGAELVEMAIEQLFTELGVDPTISKADDVKHYSAENIDIFVGNIFDVSSTILGPVSAIYDRAALVALPDDMRKRYTAHLTKITNNAPQLLVSFDYDQTIMNGPPFSVSNEEVTQHYGNSYNLTLLSSTDIPGGLKGRCAAKTNVWLLQAQV
ncbi:MAG: thiopurine S-methyltransferase [Leptolyngbyaceae cyanobacterium MAG.088]|nr:thiopurine S-methyltransferase [Leptolyngbyaceae cyanobacterium MAG.088]